MKRGEPVERVAPERANRADRRAPVVLVGGWMTRNWFLVALAGVATIAFLAPGLGARGGPLRPETTTRLAVAVIFFLQGLVIAPAALRAGALRWRLHLLVQSFVFAGFPAAVLLLDALGGGRLPADLRLGFLYLAILPTTISTCVVFTAMAGGNTSGALFNSVFANVAGVLLTPLWAALLLSARGEAPSIGPMLGEIVLLLLVPLAAGQAARPLVRRVREPEAKRLASASSMLILYIVFASFSDSVARGAFAQTGLPATVMVVVVALGLFTSATGAAYLLGRQLGFDAPDRVAVLFCAPQKTLAAGAPMAQILFSGHPGIGLVLLPVIVYHAIQLLAGATLAQRVGNPRRGGHRGG
jgi:solute carrier family 10 (sodium/bile acid cotransporter), member 7